MGAGGLQLGTRRSALALWQAEWVKQQLEALDHSVRVEIVPMTTSGDRPGRIPQMPGGTKALFTKELEEALLDGTIDLAVHSLKDMAAMLPDGLMIGAVPSREDPRDVLITREGGPFARLPSGAVIGTSSLRRRAQLLRARPDLRISALRGNVPTRIRKLRDSSHETRAASCELDVTNDERRTTSDSALDAIVLALAGVRRLGLEAEVTEVLSIELVMPAVGQGALAIEIRAGDERVQRAVNRIDDAATRRAVEAERRFAVAIGGSCDTPVAAFAQIQGDRCVIRARVLSPDGRQMIEDRLEGPVEQAEALGAELGERFLARGARALMDGRDAPA